MRRSGRRRKKRGRGGWFRGYRDAIARRVSVVMVRD